MCAKALQQNARTLESIPDCYKNQLMCDKAVDNYPHALKFVSNCCMTQKICDKAVHAYHSTTKFVPDRYETNGDIIFYNEDFDSVTFVACQRHSCCRS